MKYTLEVTQCNNTGCKSVISKKDNELVQEFHCPSGEIDNCISEWKRLFTEDELENLTAQVIRYDIN